jgi:hypothetical protein
MRVAGTVGMRVSSSLYREFFKMGLGQAYQQSFDLFEPIWLLID